MAKILAGGFPGGAVAGRAPSLGIGSAAINHHTRHPVITAALGADHVVAQVGLDLDELVEEITEAGELLRVVAARHALQASRRCR